MIEKVMFILNFFFNFFKIFKWTYNHHVQGEVILLRHGGKLIY